MKRSIWKLQTIGSHTVAVCATLFATNHTVAAQSALRVADDPAQHRLVLTLAPVSPVVQGHVIVPPAVVVGGQIGHAAMLTHFSAETLDSAGRPIASSAAWEVTVFATSEAMVHLNARMDDITVPKPFGYQVAAADSLLIVASFPEFASGPPVRLRVTIYYDPLERPASRLAVVSLPSGATGEATPCGRNWEWKPPVNGEIVALAGLELASAERLVLEDVASGQVLWRSRPAASDTRGSAAQHQPVRLSAAVEAGHIYRLTATYENAGAPGLSVRIPAIALILPSRLP